MKKLVFIALFIIEAVFIIKSANATNYPLTITDIAGRTLVFDKKPEKIATSDSFSILLTQRENPIKGVVAWANSFKRYLPDFYEPFVQKWPDAEKIPIIQFGREVNIESIISNKPDVYIATLRLKKDLEKSGAIEQLEKLGIKIFFVDYTLNPVKNASVSVKLVGQLLDREKEANEFYEYYQSKLKYLVETISKQNKRTVFLSNATGYKGFDFCCTTTKNFGWGALIDELGIKNLANDLILETGSNSEISPEVIIKANPYAMIMTGASYSSNNQYSFGFGNNADKEEIKNRILKYISQPAISSISAVKNKRVVMISHYFYSAPFNIVGLEAIAKASYPEVFKDLNPQKTYDEILERFTMLPKISNVQVVFPFE